MLSLFDAVSQSSGATDVFIRAVVNKEVMMLHLQQISKASPEGRYAALVMDCAGWHTHEIADELERPML